MLEKRGVDLGPQLAALQRQLKAGTAPLEKTHREDLLKLDDLRPASPMQQRTQ